MSGNSGIPCKKESTPKVIWFTGLSGSGKSSIADNVFAKLRGKNVRCYILDGDKLRAGLNKDLGFDKAGRYENIRRAGEIAKLFFDEGFTVLAAFISPYAESRNDVRSLFYENDFIEVFVKADIKTCIKRDVKGLYKKALDGQIPEFTGISDVYEEPQSPELILDTDRLSVDECVNKVLDFLIISN